MELENNTEIVGTLVFVDQQHNGYLQCIFSVQIPIELPATVIPPSKLKTLVGRQIAIINCDDHYAIREVKIDKNYDKRMASKTE